MKYVYDMEVMLHEFQTQYSIEAFHAQVDLPIIPIG
jgi:hypothetical protein